MGKRINEPANGYWFVPGGRIFKDETLEGSFSRISASELGKELDIRTAKLIGAFSHKYTKNFANIPNVGTHYIVLAYELELDVNLKHLPLNQHSSYRWVSVDDNDKEIHENSKTYLSHLSKRAVKV